MKLSIEGLIAAPFTPLKPNYEVNLDIIPQYADILLSQGVKHVYILGTTGEGMSLTVDERMKVAEAWKATNKMTTIMNHIGGNSIEDVKALAAHSEKIGLDCIGLLAPFYYKCANLDALITYLKQVASAAPNTPMVYYHYAEKTGVNFHCAELIEQAMANIPTFAGVKFTGWDMGTAIEAKRRFGDKVLIGYGKDEQAVAAYFLGFKTSVGSTYNWCGRLWNKAIQDVKAARNSDASDRQTLFTQVLEIMFQYGFNDHVNKSMMFYIHGIDMGPVRCPISPISDEKLSKIRSDLDQIQFKQKCLEE